MQQGLEKNRNRNRPLAVMPSAATSSKGNKTERGKREGIPRGNGKCCLFSSDAPMCRNVQERQKTKGHHC